MLLSFYQELHMESLLIVISVYGIPFIGAAILYTIEALFRKD